MGHLEAERDKSLGLGPLEASCIVILQQMWQSQCLDFRCGLRRGVTQQCSPVPRQEESFNLWSNLEAAPVGTLRGSLSN